MMTTMNSLFCPSHSAHFRSLTLRTVLHSVALKRLFIIRIISQSYRDLKTPAISRASRAAEEFLNFKPQWITTVVLGKKCP